MEELMYKTVSVPAETELVEKKSRFIARVQPVTSEQEALAFVRQVKSEHPSARHNVYAYVLRENNLQRYTDDGEPSGTAGMPVLDSIRKRNLTDVAVVVTRYFGGTLLGTGGLVRAYGGAASTGISAAKPVLQKLCEIYAVQCSYDLYGKVEYAVNQAGYTVRDTVFGAEVTMQVCVLRGEGERLQTILSETTNALATAVYRNCEYVAFQIEGKG